MPAMPHISGDVFQALRDEIRRLGGGLSPRAMLPHVTEAGLGQPGALARIPQEISEGVDHRIGVFWRDDIRLAVSKEPLRVEGKSVTTTGKPAAIKSQSLDATAPFCCRIFAAVSGTTPISEA